MKLADCPEVRLAGSVSVPALKPFPVTLICEIERVPVPLLVNWTVWLAGEPSVTLPKVMAAGTVDKVDCTALPETGITVLTPPALEMVMFPVMFSEAVGLKLTLMAAL